MPSSWMWSMHSWHIKHVYLNGASLYDHHQTDMYNLAVNASRRRKRVGVRTYESSQERREPNSAPKKEALLTMQAITEVSTKTCCQKNCLQPFPQGQIQAIRSQLHVDGGVKFRKFQLLQVHKQIHPGIDGKDVVTLEGVDVCPAAWRAIHGVSKATFYRYREMSKAGMRAEEHGNLGTKKPRMHILQATATLRLLIKNEADRMPHKSRTLESREKVPAMVLPSAFQWSDQMEEINDMN